MNPTITAHATVVRTERGLTIAGTRITLYDVMDYLTAGWPPTLIRDRLDLSEAQLAAVFAYIQTNRAEVEGEYQQVLLIAEENRRYWDEQNCALRARIALLPPQPGQEAVRAKLAAWKDRLQEAE
ncbi:MAG: DUF433 domain-containing protein [Chloroflexia bacterium]|nr:DUF433 domain-containing protein [Chloroflexia bacterium]